MKARPSKKEIAFAVTMSFVTTFFVSFILVLINLNGLPEKFLFIWMRTWLIAFILVGFSILFIAPLIRRFLNRFKFLDQ
jgi:hypothetical protein